MAICKKCVTCGRIGGYTTKNDNKSCTRCNKSKTKSSKKPSKDKK